MRFFVGVTDYDWLQFLAGRPDLDEVNFWQPSGSVPFKALQPGDLFLFKLHSPHNYIVGGAVFAHWSALPVSLAWEAFGEKNGAASREEMRVRLARYRDVADDPRGDYVIGCVLLERPFFLDRPDWIPTPRDWKPNIVRGKGYDSASGEGKRLWEQLIVRMPATILGVSPDGPFGEQPSHEVGRGEPVVVYPRLGQGTFRVVVTDIYSRRCAVTGERTLPVLQAAHIKPVAAGGSHDPRNGLLLRSDFHTLFDRGYVTVTPDLHLEVGRRIRDEFENGRDYYALHGCSLRSPRHVDLRPSREMLVWHSENVFRG